MNFLSRLSRSYYVRNVFVAVLFSGVLLAAIGVCATWAVGELDRARLDVQLRESALLVAALHGGGRLWDGVDGEMSARIAHAGRGGFTMQARDFTGNVLYQSDDWPTEDAAASYPAIEALTAEYADYTRSFEASGVDAPSDLPTPPPALRFFSARGGSLTWRILVTATPQSIIAIGMESDLAKSSYRYTRNALAIGIPFALGLIALLTVFLSHRALRPVRQLQATAERISARGLEERINVSDLGLEFEGLINVFNRMLERLERTFKQANHFSAGAAHELKTPLSVIQGELERGVQESVPGSEEQERYSRLVEQVQRLKTITHKLLLLATVDASGLRLNKAPFNLSECVQDACDDATVIAPDITQEKLIPDDIIIPADPELMPNVVTNLIINAVVHNDPDGRIGVRIKLTSTTVRVTIKNTGPGIPTEDRARLFTRFYRADKSRNRAYGGSGLGLSLARDIARAHGGDVFLVDSKGRYTTFELVLPRFSA